MNYFLFSEIQHVKNYFVLQYGLIPYFKKHNQYMIQIIMSFCDRRWQPIVACRSARSTFRPLAFVKSRLHNKTHTTSVRKHKNTRERVQLGRVEKYLKVKNLENTTHGIYMFWKFIVPYVW